VIGCLSILEYEKNISVCGMNIAIHSEIPLGKGVASSAALEVATMNAICKLYDIHLSEIELPLLAQQVENNFVGAACGLMDQLTVHLGQKNKLLPIICQPHKIFHSLSVPKGIQFTGIDSGVGHAVGGASYGDVRTGTFMAYTVIASLEGASADDLITAKQKNNFKSLPYSGYLANIPVSDFEKKYAAHLPETISGKDFIGKFRVSIDTATEISEEKNYKLLACGRHPIYENHRVNLFSQLLQQFSKFIDKQKTLALLGELMLQSHESYSSVGLGHPATDQIVDTVRQAGFSSGVYGARVTGGGSGGTVAVLSHGKQGKQTVKNIFNQYKKECSQKIFFFSGSENGALIFNQQIKHHDYIDL
jgi:L-arabinokinase